MKRRALYGICLVLGTALGLAAACGPKSGNNDGGGGASGASGAPVSTDGMTVVTGSGGMTSSSTGGFATSGDGGDPALGGFHLKDAGAGGRDAGCAGITVAGETI